MPRVWSPSQMQCYTSISSDLWTTSSFSTLSPQQRYRHNPWPKGSLRERGHCELKPPTLFFMEQFIQLLKWEGNILQRPFKPGCSPAPTWRMPDASWWYPPQIASFPTLWPVNAAGSSVLSSVCCDYRGHFSGTLCNHKATFQLSTVLSVQLSVPPGWPSPPGSPLSHCHPHPTPLSWKETFIGQGNSQQTCTLLSVVINCNAFRLDVFF